MLHLFYNDHCTLFFFVWKNFYDRGVWLRDPDPVFFTSSESGLEKNHGSESGFSSWIRIQSISDQIRYDVVSTVLQYLSVNGYDIVSTVPFSLVTTVSQFLSVNRYDVVTTVSQYLCMNGYDVVTTVPGVGYKQTCEQKRCMTRSQRRYRDFEKS